MRSGLAGTARSSLLWSGGSTLLRDGVQFATMLVLVRILSPAEYGSMALAQSVLGLVAVFSFATFSAHALQIRDPGAVDWDAHFSAALVLNLPLFGATLLLALGLTSTDRFSEAAAPLAGLALVFPVEILATFRNRMLESRHDWARFRSLSVAGTLLGAGVGVGVALLGGGVWALVVQVPLYGAPAALDLILSGYRPRLTTSWRRYRDSALFGLNRIGAGALTRGRATVEQSLLAGVYDFGALGLFSRALGLSQMLAGRVGATTMSSLYPVVTRAESRSSRFRRIAGLVVRGVAWVSIPAATFLAARAEQVVAVAYGEQWVGVVPLLGPAVAAVTALGISSTLGRLLLANERLRGALVVDGLSALFGVALALIFIPLGTRTYLIALLAHGVLMIGIAGVALTRSDGLLIRDLATALVPALVAGGLGAGCLAASAGFQVSGWLRIPWLALEASAFSMVYLVLLRFGVPRSLNELLEVAPGGGLLARILRLP